MGDPLVIFEWLGILVAAFHWDDALKVLQGIAEGHRDAVEGETEDEARAADLRALARSRTGRKDWTDPRWYLRAVNPDEVLEVPSHDLINVRTFGEGDGCFVWHGFTYQIADIVRGGWTCDLAS